MTPEEKAQLDVLCKQIAEEKDEGKFVSLILQLNALLERKGPRLESDPDKAPPQN